MGQAAVAVLVLSVVAGCGGSNGVQAIPWTDERPAQYLPRALAPPCHVSDLRMRLGGQALNGGRNEGGVLVTNVGSRSCSLLERPRIRFVARPRHTTVIRPVEPFGTLPGIDPPSTMLRALEPGERAAANFIWSGWCGGGPVSAVVTLLRGGGTVTLSARSAPPPTCNGEGTNPTPPATLLQLAPFYPIKRPPGPAVPLKVKLLGPSHPQGRFREVSYHMRGQVLRYSVALINVSKKPFTFGTCPSYSADVPPAPVEVYVLNCRPAGTIAPGGRAVFRMQTHVPPDAGGILWQLDTANAPGDHAEVYVMS